MPMRLPSNPRDSVPYLMGYYDAKLDYEVRHGKWINDNHRPKCSICGSPIPIRKIIFDGEVMWEDNSSDNYCSACGAKMVDEDE